MPLKNNPKRIPLCNDDRDIIKLGVFTCCGNEWKAKLIQLNDQGRTHYLFKGEVKNVCKKCRRKVGYKYLTEWIKRWYGHFKCFGIISGQRCGRTWTSSLTWTINNQIQSTQCKACSTDTLPYQLVS